MRHLSTPAPAARELPHSPADWDQIENPAAVREILADLQTKTRREVYQCAELYDLAYPGYPGDRDYYLEQGRHGRVLYLGVGTGRLFCPLAEANPQTVGIDNSAPMLRRLRQRSPGLHADQLIEADATEAELPAGQFDTVLAPYSFLQVIPPEKVSQLLANVRRSLAPGGKFRTDTFSPYLIPFRKPGLETNVRRIGAETRIAIYVVYDHLRRQMTELAHVATPEDEHVLEMHLSYLFPHEILVALEQAGFADVHVHGGYEQEPFDPVASQVLVYEATTAPTETQAAAPSRNGYRHNGSAAPL